jgi:hypothetical protein
VAQEHTDGAGPSDHWHTRLGVVAGMKDATREIHAELEHLGAARGFRTEREIADSVRQLRLAAEVQCRPCADLMWCVTLSEPKRAALAWVLDPPVDGITHLPVVVIEVKEITPTTKTLQADL